MEREEVEEEGRKREGGSGTSGRGPIPVGVEGGKLAKRTGGCT